MAAARHQHTAPIGEYLPAHISALAASRTQLNITAANGDVLDLGHGTYLGYVTINTPGSAVVLTIFNGQTGPAVAVIATPTAPVTLEYELLLENGLWYTYAGTTAGDVTLSVLPVAA